MYNKIDIYSKNYRPEKIPDYLVKIIEIINATNNVKVLSIIRKGVYSELTTFGMIIHNYEMIINSSDFDDECYKKYTADCSEYFYLTSLYNTVNDKIYNLTHREGT